VVGLRKWVRLAGTGVNLNSHCGIFVSGERQTVTHELMLIARSGVA
jgi:hypothetical protein